MASGTAECGCEVDCYIREEYEYGHPYFDLEDVEITFCAKHQGWVEHRYVATESYGGTFLQGTCACGEHLMGSGVTNYTTILSQHIQSTNGK